MNGPRGTGLRGPKRLRKATSSTVAARPRRGLRRPATPSGLRMDVTLSFLAASEPSALAEQPYGTAYVFRQVGGRRPGHFSRDRAERLSRLVARLESECRPRSKAERIAPEAVLRRHAARRDHPASWWSDTRRNASMRARRTVPSIANSRPSLTKTGSTLAQKLHRGSQREQAATPAIRRKKPELQGLRSWRPEAESNRCTRICSPLHSHSAIRPARGGI
jgi:hypothetical protein